MVGMRCMWNADAVVAQLVTHSPCAFCNTGRQLRSVDGEQPGSIDRFQVGNSQPHMIYEVAGSHWKEERRVVYGKNKRPHSHLLLMDVEHLSCRHGKGHGDLTKNMATILGHAGVA